MKRLSEFAATSAGWLSRRLGRGGGTTLPGVVLLRLRPDAIAEYAAQLDYGSVLISATNGKTTTARLVAAAAQSAGYRLVTNTEGSNLERGVAAAMLKGAKGADLGLFEVDEAALIPIAPAAKPAVVVLMNLFRDQLDRYGELETLVEKWRSLLDELGALPDPPTLVLNADDPNIADLGRDRTNVVWFGLGDTSHSLAERSHAADATTCRRCGTALEHDSVFLGHLGHWRCPTGDNERPTPDVVAQRVLLDAGGQSVALQYPDTTRPATTTVRSALPGLHNAYNITAAVAASVALAQRNTRTFDGAATAVAIGQTAAAFGRGEVVSIGDKQLRLLLAKNPTGVNQNIRTMLADDADVDTLVLLNDRTADGQDVSWIWDVDWEHLNGRFSSLTLGGDRAYDLALRFRYGSFDMNAVTVSASVEAALDHALAATPAGGTLQVLPTYTAMLELRQILTDRGLTSAYWSDEA